MEKEQLNTLKKKLLALGLATTMFGVTGCAKIDEDGIPKRQPISAEYSQVEDYYKYVIQSGEAVKLYKAENVYLMFNKETYEPEEYIYDTVLWDLGGQLYDLESEELLVYSSGIIDTYNEEYYNYLKDNNYSMCLADICDYVENHTLKDYYSLDEIKKLEPLIADSLKLINSVKEKVKK